VVAFLLVSALCLCLCQLAAGTAPFSSSQRAHVLTVLGRSAAAGAKPTAAATHSALRAYSILGEQHTEKQDKLCAALNKELLSAARSNALDVAYHALAAAAQLRCTSFTVPAPIKPLLQGALKERKSVADLFFASEAALALDALKGASLSEFSFKGVDQVLLNLLEEDGTVRPDADADEGTAYHAGLALQVLGNLAQKVPSAVDQAVLRQFTDKVSALFSTGVTGSGNAAVVDFGVGAPVDVTPLEALAAVLDGVSSLLAAGQTLPPSSIKKEQLIALGDYVVRNAYVSDSDDAAALATALRFVSSNPVFVPFFAAAAKENQLRVTNILGQPTTKVAVTVEAAKNRVAGAAALPARELTFTPDAADNTLFTLSAEGARALSNAAPGVYDIQLTVTPQAGAAAASGYNAAAKGAFQTQSGVSFVRKVASAGRDALIKAAAVEFALTDSAKLTAKDEKQLSSVRFPASVPALSKDDGATADASKHLHARVKLTGTKARPSAVFLQLSSAARNAVFVLLDKDNSGVYSLSLPLGSTEVLDSLSGAGVYQLSLLVGDALAEQQAAWSLGKLTLNIPAPSTLTGALAELEQLFSPRPLIAHTFRPAEARSSVLVAGVFSLALLGLFGALLLVLLRSGITLSLPTNPSEFLYALVFQCSIAALLALYALYWLRLNIFQALTGLVVIGTVAAFSGTGALRMLHQRQQQAKGHVE